jgi:hypothetical protein
MVHFLMAGREIETNWIIVFFDLIPDYLLQCLPERTFGILHLGEASQNKAFKMVKFPCPF